MYIFTFNKRVDLAKNDLHEIVMIALIIIGVGGRGGRGKLHRKTCNSTSVEISRRAAPRIVACSKNKKRKSRTDFFSISFLSSIFVHDIIRLFAHSSLLFFSFFRRYF